MAEHTGYYSGLSDYQNVNDVLAQAEEIKDEAVAAQTLATAAAVTSQAALDVINPNLTAIQNAGANAATATAGAATATSASNLAQQWATNPVDVPVTSGLYSAYHWAQKAQAVVVGGLDAVYLRRDGNLNNLGNVATARTNLGLGTAATQASTAFQAANTALASIAGLTTSANQMIYTTGSNVYATLSATTYGRSLLSVADAAAARTTLGLGTAALNATGDFQPIATKLTNFNATTNTANSLVYNTAATTFAVTPLTAAARSVLDDNTTDDMLTTLGVNRNQIVRAWAMWNGTTAGTATVDAGFNVSSITKNATGRWTLNFVIPVGGLGTAADYGIVGNGVNTVAVAPTAPAVVTKDYTNIPANTNSSCGIACMTAASATDKSQMFAMVIGNAP